MRLIAITLATALTLGVAGGATLLSARAAPFRDEGCKAFPEGASLDALHAVRRALIALRYEHRCELAPFPSDPEAFAKKANDAARLGWQLVSVTAAPESRVLVCFKRPRGAGAR